jgi:hypothetical protein
MQHHGMWWGGYSNSRTEEHGFLVYLRDMLREARQAEKGQYDIGTALRRYRTLGRGE